MKNGHHHLTYLLLANWTISTVQDGTPNLPNSGGVNVLISEIQFNTPASWGDSDAFEFIELYNPKPYDTPIGGYYMNAIGLTSGAGIPDGAVIPSNGFIVLAKNPSFYDSECTGPDCADSATRRMETDHLTMYDGGNAESANLFSYPGNILDSGEKLTLVNSNGRIIDQVEFKSDATDIDDSHIGETFDNEFIIPTEPIYESYELIFPADGKRIESS